MLLGLLRMKDGYNEHANEDNDENKLVIGFLINNKKPIAAIGIPNIRVAAIIIDNPNINIAVLNTLKIKLLVFLSSSSN